jgi:23S rRNA (adenine2030-N6)-methyltransferase
MLGYRHGFHAGNFADVFKHVVLTALLLGLRRKDTPFVYVDTHAGAGRYDLRAEMAQKTREYETGIARVWGRTDAPAAVAAYLAAVQAANRSSPPPDRVPPTAKAIPRWYPGSPCVARHFLRAGDRMLLAELHGADASQLTREFGSDRKVQVVRDDGYHLLKSHLPPLERRGLVFIDPAYELRNEINRVIDGLQEGYRRWATGIYAIWYPIMPKIAVALLRRRITDIGIRKVLCTELCVLPDDNPLGMNGCGMILVNPPFKLDEELRDTVPWLWSSLAETRQGRHGVEWLAA